MSADVEQRGRGRENHLIKCPANVTSYVHQKYHLDGMSGLKLLAFGFHPYINWQVTSDNVEFHSRIHIMFRPVEPSRHFSLSLPCLGLPAFKIFPLPILSSDRSSSRKCHFCSAWGNLLSHSLRHVHSAQEKAQKQKGHLKWNKKLAEILNENQASKKKGN